MEIIYSSNDTIEKYTTLFNEFKNIEDEYLVLNVNRKLIDFSAGLGLSNSIHERFIKSIIEDYKAISTNTLSNARKTKIIKLYKAPQNIENFIVLLGLDVSNSYNMFKAELPQPNTITSFENLVEVFNLQRPIRNAYLHGDFNFNENIEFSNYKMHLLDHHKYHLLILKIVRHSFFDNIHNLPNEL